MVRLARDSHPLPVGKSLADMLNEDTKVRSRPPLRSTEGGGTGGIHVAEHNRPRVRAWGRRGQLS